MSDMDEGLYLQRSSNVFVMMGDASMTFSFDDQLSMTLVGMSAERSKNLLMLAMLEDAIVEAKRVIT